MKRVSLLRLTCCLIGLLVVTSTDGSDYYSDLEEDVVDQCAVGCASSWMGDSMCDHECNNEACQYDGGDCDPARGGANLVSNFTLHKLMSSHMVLQTENPSLFGWANPGEVVTATLGKETAEAKADVSGKWLIRLADRAASFTPVSITITDGTDSVDLHDVLFGDVWVCG
jgi:hypothetical protein